ncbi:ATP-binding cassette sub-family G member 4-like isoform X2 [Homalodisca vitripennis]|nr:ATP-binding cassette sub-family G member 4-like isoform X1 [Homalodisca vitripennis]XP_046664038.1 ATP-binding cassette sub-family G member 4-like isoform X1 [Homalodisca vitripennis]XP_046664039.1 ATP-binding cassette sub-family G member 4-like isoform X1 [Homalodisca vitripennis]XP_046664040.1 ATP-binding cassette sub-family G member 4-like isoform X1 [Homalodisca vitripennis]XP_046664041.1 ATP-binding cassette sub-family G member 4-like isoform X2 [Homalodisca vitripennis]
MVTQDIDVNSLVPDRKGSVKVTITPCQPRTLTHLPKRPPVDIAFSDLTYTVKEGRKNLEKTILKSVSGRLRSGELTAIMGPSGAGKSTLLNILTGYKVSGMSGSITINGHERNLSQFAKLSAYIMQDNQLHGNLSVDEAMNVATALKLGSDLNKQDKAEVIPSSSDGPTIYDGRGKDRRSEYIQEILETLGLQDHKNTMTSNLSGGQKKRLSIALELVNNPPIMFFDEPTSGLDSSSCFQCISLLKSLSRGGRTIICTIHQPSARLFEMFDHLYTLADGQCVYQGSTLQLVPFLGKLGLVCPSYHNPASFVIEVSCGEYGDNVRKLVNAIKNGKHDIQLGKPFPEIKALNNANEKVNNTDVATGDTKMSNGLESSTGNGMNNMLLACATNDIAKDSAASSDAVVIPVDLTSEKTVDVTSTLLDNALPNSQKRYGTSEFNQFWIVLKRTLLFSRRDWTLMYLRLFAHILVGFLIGALYYDIGNDGAKVLSNLGFLFFNMLFLMYTSMTITILSFPLEMPVLVKENFNRWYSLRSYYLAITVSDIPFQAVFCVVYVSIVYYMTSQPPEAHRYWMFLGACLLISFVAQSVGLVVGAAMNVQNGVFLAPVMSVPFLLFSGFFVSFDAIPVYLRWITYLSYIRYGFEGTALATYSFGREKLLCFQVYCHFKDPETTLEELDMLDASFTLDIVALVIIFFTLRITAFLFLRWKLMSAR